MNHQNCPMNHEPMPEGFYAWCEACEECTWHEAGACQTCAFRAEQNEAFEFFASWEYRQEMMA
jgi:hypothetical protein